MHLYREHDVFDKYELVKYSIYIMDVGFRDFIEKFKNIGGGHMLLFLILISKRNYLIWNIQQQIWLVAPSCLSLLKWLNVNTQIMILKFMITKTEIRKQLV